MSQLLLNSVVMDCADNQRYRVVLLENGRVILFALHPNPNSQCRTLRFRVYSFDEMTGWISSGKMTIVEDHPYHPPSHNPSRIIPDKIIVVSGQVLVLEKETEKIRKEEAFAIRDKREVAVNAVMSRGFDIFLGRERSRIMEEIADQHKVSRQALAKWVGQFLTLGMVPDALLPRFGECGGRGQKKQIGEVKRGAPSILGDGGGCNITPEMAEKMDDFIAKKMKTGDSVPDLFQEFSEKECVAGKEIGPDGEIQFIFKPAHMTPTFEVFEKHYHAVDYKQKTIALHGERDWTNLYREILGNEGSRAQLPGACYQIDFHVPDLLLRHPYYPTTIGRGYLGAVVDVCSPMVPGLRFSMAPGSTQEALLLMQCAFLPKVPYCRQYGLEIEPEQWPAHGLCSWAFADNGELGNERAGRFFSQYGIQFENERAYNPTDKGTVERFFGVLEEHEISWLPGNTRGKRKFGDRVHRLDGKLSPQAFQQILILALLKRLKEEVYDRFMPTDAIRQKTPPSALGLWDWTMRRGLGGLREVPDVEILRLSSLMTLNARIKGRGLIFKNLHYVSEELNSFSYFAKRRKKSEWVMVAYDLNLIDYIYVVEGGKIYRCHLAEKEMAMYGEQQLSFDDMKVILEEQSRGKVRYRRHEKLKIDSDHRSKINQIIAQEEDFVKHLQHPVGYSVGGGAASAEKLQRSLVRKAFKKIAALTSAPGNGQDSPGKTATPHLRVLPAPGKSKAAKQPAVAAETTTPTPVDPNIEFLRKLRRKPL